MLRAASAVALAALIVAVAAPAPHSHGSLLAAPAMLTSGSADAGGPAEWGFGLIGAPEIWRISRGAPSVVIAVVDTGVDVAVPDLAGAAEPGVNVLDGTRNVVDGVGHGTLVAEVALGRGTTSDAGLGMCWRCTLLPVKVAAAGGTVSAASLAAGIRWAADHGANVVNVSLVLSAPDADVAAAVAYAEARGALVVAAAGNDGGTDPTYPAAYPGVLGVVATDEHDRPYPWAQRGPWARLTAPGCARAAAADGAAVDFCGSSAAAPAVSGLAGLVWAATPAATASSVAARLVGTAVPVPHGVASGGRIDAAALAATLK